MRRKRKKAGGFAESCTTENRKLFGFLPGFCVAFGPLSPEESQSPNSKAIQILRIYWSNLFVSRLSPFGQLVSPAGGKLDSPSQITITITKYLLSSEEDKWMIVAG